MQHVLQGACPGAAQHKLSITIPCVHHSILCSTDGLLFGKQQASRRGCQLSPAYGWQVSGFGRSDDDVPEAPPLKGQRQLSGALDDVQCFVHAHLCDALHHTFFPQ